MITKDCTVYYHGPLPTKGDYRSGLFRINTKDKTTPVEIGISNTLLATWGRDNDAAWGSALIELGSLMAELMWLRGNVGDYIFATNDHPQNFQAGEEGYRHLKSYLENQIEQLLRH